MPELSLDQANRLIAGSLYKAREMGLPPISVAVLDAGGHLKAMQREDGQSFLRAQICQAKAWGALALGTDSRHIADRYEQELRQQGLIDALNSMSDGKVIPLPGGLLIQNQAGETLGAVGVAGALSEQDEQCALAGIYALELLPPNRTSSDPNQTRSA